MLARSLALVLAAGALASCVVHHHHYETPTAAHEAGAPVLERGLEGVVVDAEGEPVRARVSAVGATGSSTTSCDDAGRFSLASLPREAVALVATTTDGRIGVVRDLAAAAEPVRITVDAGARLTVATRALPGTRLAVRHEGLPILNHGVEPDAMLDVVVPAGTVELLLYRADRSQHRTLDVGAGEEASVEFRADVE